MPLTECRLLDLPRFDDKRGSLSFVEGRNHVPFDIARVYYLYGMPGGADRGAHAHRALRQLIIPLAGEFDAVLDDGSSTQTFHLDRPQCGLYVGPMVWRTLVRFSEHAVCLVLASARYDEADYFRDYDAFLRAVRN